MTGLAIDTTAIVDTGASSCLFPEGCAAKLQYDIGSAPAIQIHTANGSSTGHILTTRVSVLGSLPDGQADKKNVLTTIGDLQVVYLRA